MADRELLERIDARMARGNQLMDLIREEHRLNREAMYGTRDALRSMAAEVRRSTDESTTAMAGMRASLEDMRDQIQANTRAVLAVLDALRGGAPGPSGAAA